MLGREVYMTIDIQVGQQPQEPERTEHEYVENLRIVMVDFHVMVVFPILVDLHLSHKQQI